MAVLLLLLLLKPILSNSEQDLVGIAAGMARCGKRTFPMSPACFLTTRSYEQCKVDVAYSHTNVKLIGISGGVSYGALVDGAPR